MTYKSRQQKLDPAEKNKFKMDRGGFISPNLQRLRLSPNRSREENHQLRDIERARFTPVTDVIIPDSPTGHLQLAAKHNSPGNLKFKGRDYGDIPMGLGEKQLANFYFPTDGFYALENRIRQSKSRNETLETFISIYAPPTDHNNTELYITEAAKRFGVDRSTPLTFIQTREIAEFMAHHESKTKVIK
jgi:hypothetical protein